MIFGEFPLAECDGLLLAHTLRLPDRMLKKGYRLTSADFSALAAAGIQRVTGARLEADDVDENTAAGRIAAALLGPGTSTRAPQAGRCNLYAVERGLLSVNAGIIDAINRLDESVTVATLPPLSAVRAGAVIATVKIIPLSVKRGLLDHCAMQAKKPAHALTMLPFRPRRAALIVTERQGDPSRNYATAVNSSRRRLAEFGSHLGLVQRCAHDSGAVTAALHEALAAGCSLILIAGTTVPKDRADTVPAGIVAAGGDIVHFGMPVEPGNMLLLARIGAVPVIILPGCARSRRSNGLDWVLQRLLAGLPMAGEQIMAMGVGGLIRSALEAGDDETATLPEPAKAPAGRKVAALILAAGSGSRMGGDKLLRPVGGVPMVRRAANAALASRCSSVHVVTGASAGSVEACLAGLDVDFIHNPDHATGMASSLRAGLAGLVAENDAVIVLLADMPWIDGGHIDRLLAAFDAQQPRIVVPMHAGRRGNPIVWPRRYFDEMQRVQGDVGARELLQRHAEEIESVEFDDAAIFADVDTPEALAALETKP